MLTTSFRESDGSLVTVRDTTPEAFRAVLQYAYTNQLICDDQSILDVMRKAKEVRARRCVHPCRNPFTAASLVFSSQVDLRHLFSLCEVYCYDHLSPFNAITWLVRLEEQQLSDQLSELRALTLTYIQRNIPKILDEASDTLRLLSKYSDLSLHVVNSVVNSVDAALAPQVSLLLGDGPSASSSQGASMASSSQGSSMASSSHGSSVASSSHGSSMPAGTKRQRDEE